MFSNMTHLSIFQDASTFVLKEDAVPTIFDFTVNNQSENSRKRAQEPVSLLRRL